MVKEWWNGLMVLNTKLKKEGNMKVNIKMVKNMDLVH